ncbi:hypothetical protein pb186bvf_000215 [Paramecium bursaria]
MFFIILFQLYYQQEINNYRQLAVNICHKSCLSCYGQEKNNCLTCRTNSRRAFNEELQKCQCLINYFDYEDECLQFEDLDNFVQYSEQEDQSLQCYPGEYYINNQCVRCPQEYYPVYKSFQYLLCGNCYDYPFQFKDDLRCSYDYIQFNQNESFLKIQRNDTDQTIYFINDQQLLQICFGCKQICINWNRYSCFKSNYVQNKEELFIQCKENFYFNDGQCMQCEDNCEICSQLLQSCQKCKIGYYLQDNKCKLCQPECLDCDNRNNNYYCMSCITGYAQDDGLCIQCGSYCLQCQIQQLNGILYNICLQCTDNYFRSIDFQNCLRNTIQNCLIEFQLDKVNKLSSLDYPKQVNKSAYLIYQCAQCDKFYENHITKCQFNSQLGQNQQIIKFENQILVDSKQKNENTDCIIQNCDQCIVIILNGKKKNLCHICNQGYYGDVITGQCLKCSINCSNCIETNKNQSDQWKRIILLFYQVYLQPITQFEIINDLLYQDYSIICLKCKDGYKEFDGKCIEDCQQPCKKCKIINGQSYCIQCLNSLYGQNLSGGLKCVQCQPTCQLCSVQIIFFGIALQKCLIPHEQFLNSSYNFEMGQFTICEPPNKSCKKIIQNNIIAYCDSTRYYDDMINSNDPFFSQKNIILEQAFSSILEKPYYFSGSQMFEDVIIKFNIKYIIIDLILHSLNDDVCVIQSYQDYIRRFYRNLTIIGQGNTLYLKNIIELKYYLKLEFRDVNLVLQNLNITIKTYFFYLQDCNITIQSQSDKSQFQIYSRYKKFQKVSIKDSNITQVNGFFSFMDSGDFICQNFYILSCNFLYTYLFTFNILVQNKIQFENLYVSANFKNSIFLKHYPRLPNDLIVNQCQLQVYMYKSTFLQLNLLFKLEINQFIMNQSYITESILFDTFSLDFKFGYFLNTTFNDSFILSVGFQVGSKTLISDFKFQNIIIIMHSDEFIARVLSSQLIFKSMIFLNISSQSTQILTQFYFFYLYGNEINISEFYIIDTYGYTLIFIDTANKLLISNIHQLNQQKYRVSSDLKCKNLNSIKQNSQLINIQDFNFYIHFKNILVHNNQIENYPYISISTITSDKRLYDKQISFYNIFIYDNILNALKQDDKISMIMIDTIQQIEISIEKNFISKNILMDYSTKIMNFKFTLIYIKAQQSLIIISNNVFLQNFAFNSDKNLFNIIGSQINAKFNLFKSNNYFDPTILLSRIYIDYDSENDLYLEHIQIKFKIYSGSAIINLMGELIIINHLSIINSQSNCLTIAPQKYLSVNNSKFLNIKFTQYNKIYVGAAILIPLNNSLTFIEIINSQFIYCSSVTQGGSINIVSQQEQTYLKLQNITVFNSFSLLGSFLSCTDTKGYFVVTISNLYLKNTEIGLINHFKNLDVNTTIKYVGGYFLEFYRIHIQLQNIQVINNFLTPILFSIQTQNCQINNLYLLNSIFGSDSPINLKIDNNQRRNSEIQNIYFLNNKLLKKLFECEVMLRVLHDVQQFCNQVQYQKLTYFFNSSYHNNFGKCMINSAIQNQQAQHLIYIDTKYQKNQKIKLQNIIIKNNLCDECQKGLVTIQLQSQEKYSNVLLLRLLNFQSNNCGFEGCLQLNAYDTMDILNQKIILVKSKFIDNIAKIGGGVHIQGSQIFIKTTQILNNRAEQGGGILSDEQSLSIIVQSEIYDNKALIGSQISLIKKFPINKLNIVLNKDKDELNQINEPFSKLQLQYNGKNLINRRIQNNDSIIEYVMIKSYNIKGYNQTDNIIYVPSGQKLRTYELFDNSDNEYRNINLSLRIFPLNQFEEKIVLNSSASCVLLGKFNSTNNLFSDIYFNPNTIFFDQKTQDFNLDDLIITFDPANNDSLLVQVVCSSIKVPIYSNQTQKFSHVLTNYTLYFNLKTFYCQQGEYYNMQKSACEPCDVSQYFYSVQPKNKCKQIDPSNMISIQRSKVQLRQGFWRPDKQNDHIEYCYHQSFNCNGGWQPGQESCLVGHIGALCEQCDLYNIRGQGSFSIDKLYSCGSCSDTAINILIFLGLSAWTLISVQMTVEGSKEIIDYLNLSLRMKKIGLRMQIYKDQYSSILLKLFMNYILILGTITTFQLDIPGTFGFILTNVSNPLQAMSYSLDCFMIKITDIDIVYFRMIWSMLMPFVYILIYLFAYLVALIFNKTTYNFGTISTCLLYLYSYIQPNFIGGLTSLLAYRQISSINWISSNVSYQYSTQNHYNWIIQFILPTIIVYGLLIPLFFTLRLLTNKRAILYSITFRKTWGYLYNEYQTNAYFWEIIKLSFRQFIITFLTIYDDFVLIKGSLIFLMLLIYDRISEIYRPYSTRMMNQLDSKSNLVCASSIIIALIIYLISQQNQVSLMIFGYFLLGFINFYFISYIFIQILRAYFYQYDQVLDKFKRILKTKLPKLEQYHPFIKYLLQETHEKNLRLRLKSKIIRLNVIKSQNQLSTRLSPYRPQEKRKTTRLQTIQQSSIKARMELELPIFKYNNQNPSTSPKTFENLDFKETEEINSNKTQDQQFSLQTEQQGSTFKIAQSEKHRNKYKRSKLNQSLQIDSKQQKNKTFQEIMNNSFDERRSLNTEINNLQQKKSSNL